MGKLGTPTDLSEAEQVAEGVCWSLMETGYFEAVVTAGSVRRRRPVVSDVDIMLVGKDPGLKDLTVLTPWLPEGIRWTAKGGVADVLGVRVECYLSPHDGKGAMLQFLTGPGSLNVYLRKKAMSRQLTLSQYGLRRANGRRLDDPDLDMYAGEEQIFALLGVPYMDPEERDRWQTML